MSTHTELFMSDIHGEYESFAHVLRTRAGELEHLIAQAFPDLGAADATELLMFCCYPDEKTAEVKNRLDAKADEALALLSERKAAVDKLLEDSPAPTVHIVGDIYDRGPAPDLIMDEIARLPHADIQWGNHDIVWMGAALGQPGCIAHVMRICSRYSNLPILTERYHMDLTPVEEFACATYADDPCVAYGLKGSAALTPEQQFTNIRVQKAMAIIQYKVEGQLIEENPSFGLEDRKLLHHIDYERGMVTIDGVEHELTDRVFPTVDPADPYKLTEGEQGVLSYLQKTFVECEQLQRHIRMFLDQGGLYSISGNALMFHACVPLNPDGSLMEVNLFGESLSGKVLFDTIDQHVRNAFENTDPAKAKQGRDLLWYLWLGAGSPLFGKSKMATFERYVVESKQARAEEKNAFYRLQEDQEVHDRIFEDFGMNPETSYLVCGHVPVKIKDGESPVRCDGRHFNIDGGFSEAYQPTTGIAGLTLMDKNGKLSIIEHQPFHRLDGITGNKDMDSMFFQVTDK